MDGCIADVGATSAALRLVKHGAVSLDKGFVETPTHYQALSDRSEAPLRLIRLDEVKRLTALSTSTVYRKVGAGEFPTPVKLGSHSVAWVEAEVLAWIRDRIKARPGTGVVEAIKDRNTLPKGAAS